MAHFAAITGARGEKGLASDLNLDGGSRAFKNPNGIRNNFFAGSAFTFADGELLRAARQDVSRDAHRDERIRIDPPRPESTGGDR
jgi:hypothetical protein